MFRKQVTNTSPTLRGPIPKVHGGRDAIPLGKPMNKRPKIFNVSFYFIFGSCNVLEISTTRESKAFSADTLKFAVV